MINSKTNQIATHIGHDVVAVALPAIAVSRDTSGNPFGGLRHSPRITLLSADGCDEGAYFPAQSIMINGVESIKQLRDFCNAVLEPKEETKP
jgi:hypothetical protein